MTVPMTNVSTEATACAVRHTGLVSTTATEPPRRRGRPPDSTAAETYAAILAGARRLFGERGYGSVTNKDLAAEAGVTTGALYHYVESKLDLYVAVHADMRTRVYSRFQRAEASQSTFLGKLSAVLDAAQQLNVDDPSLARFVGVVRADVRRYPDVAERLAESATEREDFFLDLVEVGVSTGEVQPEDVPAVREFVRVILVGLFEGTLDDPVRHRRAVDSVMGVLSGSLIRPIR